MQLFKHWWPYGSRYSFRILYLIFNLFYAYKSECTDKQLNFKKHSNFENILILGKSVEIYSGQILVWFKRISNIFCVSSAAQKHEKSAKNYFLLACADATAQPKLWIRENLPKKSHAQTIRSHHIWNED
jgi:hypothetical protein